MAVRRHARSGATARLPGRGPNPSRQTAQAASAGKLGHYRAAAAMAVRQTELPILAEQNGAASQGTQPRRCQPRACAAPFGGHLALVDPLTPWHQDGGFGDAARRSNPDLLRRWQRGIGDNERGINDDVARYEAHAAEPATRDEAVRPEKLHGWLAHLLPDRRRALVLPVTASRTSSSPAEAGAVAGAAVISGCRLPGTCACGSIPEVGA
jgi:hypothetical protein